MHFFLNVLGQHRFSLEKLLLLLAEPKDPNPTLLSCQEHTHGTGHCPAQAQGPGVSGDTVPKSHRNPSQQINFGCCNTSLPATPKSPGAGQDGKQKGISLEKQVQRESPKVTNATGWHLLSLDCTIPMGFTRPKQLHTILRTDTTQPPLNHEAQPSPTPESQS